MTTPALPDTRSYRIEGAATLLSSLSHGGERAGTVSYFRREKILSPSGAVTEVPIVSGNALRGLLRDHAAMVFWRALGSPPLPTAVFHLLWSGGALAKAGGGKVLDARRLTRVRQLVPLVSLFGGSGAGRIIEGKLAVGKLTPVCGETAHILPADLVSANAPSMWELLQIEEFTRRDDSKRDVLTVAIEGAPTPADTEQMDLEMIHDAPATASTTDGPAQQMRYGVETLAIGTQLHWWISLRGVTDVETALFAAAVDAWTSEGAHIGGRSATGHGRLRLDVHQWVHATPTTTIGTALATEGDDELAAHVMEHRDDILSALDWFS